MHLRLFSRSLPFSALVAVLVLLATLALAVPAANQLLAQSNSAPDFGAETATRSVNEYTGSNLASDSPWFENIGLPITATDDNNDRITYTIKNSHTSPFYIDWFTGQLQVGSPLDYEDASSHTLTVVATDPSGETDEITVTVNVNNVDENGNLALMWKPASGSGVEFKAEVTDPDGITGTPTWQWASASSSTGTYTNITGATSATFTHDGTHNYLKVTATYEDEAFGAGKTLSKTRSIEPPSNIDSSYTLNFVPNTSAGYDCSEAELDICLLVSKNITPGTDVYYPANVNYTKTDSPKRYPSRQGISYSLGGTDAQYFDIDPGNGDLLAKGPHGYTDKDSYLFTITATDPSGRNDTVNLKVGLKGGLNNPVVFGPVTITYPENGTWPLADYEGHIHGRTLNQDVGWLVSVEPGGGDGDFFDLDDDGVLRFVQPPDFESPADGDGDNEYQFSLNVYNTNPPLGTTFYSVKVRVVNSQEALEIDGPMVKEHPEGTKGPIHTYTVTGATGNVSWSLAGQDSGLFTINNGELSFVNIPDYEMPFDASDPAEDQNDYLLNIYVTDGNNSGKVEPVRIMVTNVNESPYFPDTENGRRSIAEDAEVNDVIGDPITATDPDGDSQLLEYSISGADASSFTVGAYDGQLSLAEELDFETKSSYSFTLSVTDNADAEGNVDSTADDTLDVTVTVVGANEAPAFKESGAVTREVDENTAKGGAVGDPVAAEDPESAQVTYSLDSASTDFSSFTIDTNTGQIKTNIDVLDYETKDTYYVTVNATDGVNPSISKEVTINVRNVNETPVISGDQSPEHPENSTAEIAAYTADDEEDNNITWGLKETGDHSHFEISGAGSLSFSAEQNFEQPSDSGGNRSYQVTITASDGNTAGELAVTVTLTNVNEAPELAAHATPIEFEEGKTGDVARFTASDVDQGDTLTWTLEGSGTDEDYFDLNGGRLSFKQTPDYELEVNNVLKNSFSLTVKVTDSGSPALEDTLDVVVNVTDKNETHTISAGDTARDYPENDTSVISTYEFDDPDQSNSITWSLDTNSADDDDLAIDSATGELTFNSSPNYEDPTDSGRNNTYSVTVVAADGTHRATRNVTLTVTNVNEGPDITGPSAVTVVEGRTATGAKYVHNDPEGASDASWDDPITGTDGSLFQISSSGALSFKTAPDFETPSDSGGNNIYELTLTARDSEFNDSLDVTVTVEDDSVIPNVTGPTSVNFRENSASAVADYDDNYPGQGTVTWAVEGTDNADFTISASGQLKFSAPPDYENPADSGTNNQYDITIRATIAGDTDELDVAVHVTDVTEPPGRVSAPTVEPNPNNNGQNSLVAEWDEPDNSGPAVTKYLLRYAQKGASNWKTDESSDREEDLNDLLPDTEYQVMVRAENDEGVGSWSAIGEGRSNAKPESEWVQLTATFASASYSVNEGSSVTIRVNLSDQADRRQAIPISLTRNTAESGDYTVSGLSGGALNFVPGNTYVTFRLKANSDSDTEDERVTIRFGSPMPAKVTAGTTTSVSVTIRDDDDEPPPVITPPNTNNNDNDDNDRDEGNNTPNSPVSISQSPIVTGGNDNSAPVKNRPPYFVEGVSAVRQVDEHSAEGISFGEPVTAKDPDGDVLTYALGGADADSFSLDTTNGQLITMATLDFESKPSYHVVMTVADGRGAVDAIEITINLDDITEVPIYNPQTQAAGWITPGRETTVATPDGAAAVTFPPQSRSTYYWVRVDSGLARCPFDAGDEELLASLAVDFYDNWGAPEFAVLLENGATVHFMLEAADFGGLDVVRRGHRQGAFSVYVRDSVTWSWTEVSFDFEMDEDGNITISIPGLTSLNCFVLTALTALFAPAAPIAAPTPTPTPAPETQAPEPTPAAESTPVPTPTVESQGIRIPLLVPASVVQAGGEVEPTPEAGAGKETEPIPVVVLQDAQLGPQVDGDGMPLWPLLLMALGAALLAFSLWLFLRARRRRRF